MDFEKTLFNLLFCTEILLFYIISLMPLLRTNYIISSGTSLGILGYTILSGNGVGTGGTANPFLGFWI